MGQLTHESLGHAINDWKVNYSYSSCQCWASIRCKFLFDPSSYIIEPLHTLGNSSCNTRERGIYNVSYLFPNQLCITSPWRLVHCTINLIIRSLNLPNKNVSVPLRKVWLWCRSAYSSVFVKFTIRCSTAVTQETRGADWPWLRSTVAHSPIIYSPTLLLGHSVPQMCLRLCSPNYQIMLNCAWMEMEPLSWVFVVWLTNCGRILYCKFSLWSLNCAQFHLKHFFSLKSFHLQRYIKCDHQ